MPEKWKGRDDKCYNKIFTGWMKKIIFIDLHGLVDENEKKSILIKYDNNIIIKW